MLKEIYGVADDPPARRRWFHDDYFDLFVWQAEGKLTLFQLCYGMDSKERALVWDQQRGFFHDGPPAAEEVFALFEEAPSDLPEDIRREVGEKVHEFAAGRISVQARPNGFRGPACQGPDWLGRSTFGD